MSKQPNIIIFFSDQQRWDTVGAYGQKLNVTPNLDHMANEGVRFEYAFTPQPVCGPARACIQTGQYGTQHGSYRNGIALKDDENLLAKRFNRAGYETSYIGKWHLATTDGTSSEDIGEFFDYCIKPIPSKYRGGYKDFWVASDVLEFTSHGYGGHMFDKDMNRREIEGYRADGTTDFALEYLQGRDYDKPFFMMVSYIEPHHQNDRNTYEGPNGSKEKFEDFEVPGDLVGTQGNWRENYPDYLGCCNSLDYNLGRIRDEVEKQGIKDDTIILYFSDHGSHFKTRNAEYKRSCHDASLRIPLIIYGPGFKGGKVCQELTSIIDIPKTIIASAGISSEGMEGHDLRLAVNNDTEDWPDSVFSQISENHVGRCIRTHEWKYSVASPEAHANHDMKSDIYIESHLYDLKADPYELNNLVKNSEYSGVCSLLQKKLINHMLEIGEDEPQILPYQDGILDGVAEVFRKTTI